MSKPVVLDFFCGLGGWSKGFIEEGWDAIGFDIERHEYGDKRYPGELLLYDVLKLNGYDLAAANPSAIVASPPCQEFSYMAMPFGRGKRIAAALRGQGEFPEGYTGSRTIDDLCRLFHACFRIQREVSDALGRQVPMVVENVKGAQPWVGRAQANYGSYFLWGDVANVGGRVVRPDRIAFGMPAVKAVARRHKFNPDGTEHGAGSWFAVADSKTRGMSYKGEFGGWFNDYKARPDGGTIALLSKTSLKSPARKAASAMIAEIPFDLAAHVARVFKP